MVGIVSITEFPDLPGLWVATEEQPPGRHATYTQKLKLKFECALCTGKKGKKKERKAKWTSINVCRRLIIY
jgi:hypothetical protein